MTNIHPSIDEPVPDDARYFQQQCWRIECAGRQHVKQFQARDDDRIDAFVQELFGFVQTRQTVRVYCDTLHPETARVSYSYYRDATEYRFEAAYFHAGFEPNGNRIVVDDYSGLLDVIEKQIKGDVALIDDQLLVQNVQQQRRARGLPECATESEPWLAKDPTGLWSVLCDGALVDSYRTHHGAKHRFAKFIDTFALTKLSYVKLVYDTRPVFCIVVQHDEPTIDKPWQVSVYQYNPDAAPIRYDLQTGREATMLMREVVDRFAGWIMPLPFTESCESWSPKAIKDNWKVIDIKPRVEFPVEESSTPAWEVWQKAVNLPAQPTTTSYTGPDEAVNAVRDWAKQRGSYNHEFEAKILQGGTAVVTLRHLVNDRDHALFTVIDHTSAQRGRGQKGDPVIHYASYANVAMAYVEGIVSVAVASELPF